MRGRQLVVQRNDERLDEQMRSSQMAHDFMKIGIGNLHDGFGTQPFIAISGQEDRIVRAWPRRALNRHGNQRSSARWDGKQSQRRIVELWSRWKTAVYGSVKHRIIR